MNEVSYTVRTMRKEDVPQVQDAWKETSYLDGKYCLYTWLEVDPEAFAIAVTNTGEVIGACGAIIHHDDLACVGSYVVRKKYRGLGIGYKVWSACMDHIGSRNAALNAVPDKVELYRGRGGFPIIETEWKYIINESINSRVNHEALSNEPPAGVDVQPFQEPHLPHIFEYDLALIGYKREQALELNCKEKDSRTMVAFKDGKCVGFGTNKLSYCHNVGQIGPLYADDPAVAEVILRRLIAALPEATGFTMITISTNAPANKFIKSIGCPTIDWCPQMFRKEKVIVDNSKIYAMFDINYTVF